MNIVDLNKLASKSYTNIQDIVNKRILIRSCLNVTVDEEGRVTDETRLNESIPLIRELGSKAKNLVITAHLGRPTERTKNTSFWNVAELLNRELESSGISVKLIEDLTEASVEEINSNANKNQIFLLENIRYFKGEDAKEPEERIALAKQLASLADVFINDAFADYKESASTYDIANHLPSYIGPLFNKEIVALSKFNNPIKPFVAVLGGAKLSEKLDAMKAMAEVADKVLVGGAMAYTLLQAKGVAIGKSKIEADKLEVAKEIVQNYSNKIILPVDHMVSAEFSDNSSYEYTNSQEISEDKMGIDIGWETIKKFKNELQSAGSILWNGPMGVFEWNHSAVGTQEIGKAIGDNLNAYKLAGGGDSIAAINKLGLTGFNHISTGGGAMLAFLAYNKFPTLDVIINQSA